VHGALAGQLGFQSIDAHLARIDRSRRQREIRIALHQQHAGGRTRERAGDAGHDREGFVQENSERRSDRRADDGHQRLARID